MRTGCALVATSPRVGWWASWSRLQSSSARSVPQRLLQPSSHPPGARRTELGLAASSWLDQGRLWCPQIASALRGRGCHNGHTLIPTACSLARDNSTVLPPFTRVATKPQRGETACPGLHNQRGGMFLLLILPLTEKDKEELLRDRQGSMTPSLGHSTGLQDLYRPRQLREMGQQKPQSHPSIDRSGSDSQ